MVKWVKEDYKGNPQVWYSGDLIKKIKDICIKMPYQAIEKILKLIESEDK